MKKILAAVLCLAFVFTSGCKKLLNGKYDPDLSIGEQIKTRHYNHSAEIFGKNELLDEIIDASQKKDTARISDLFSDYALENAEDLDKEIEEYFKNFPQIETIKDRSCSVSGSHNRGSTEYKYLYTIAAKFFDKDGNEFRFIAKWIEGNTEDPGMQGMHSIQLITQEMYSKHKYTLHSWEDEPGVYVYFE
jgi:hypothetical protein